jgi:hypothetical protein
MAGLVPATHDFTIRLRRPSITPHRYGLVKLCANFYAHGAEAPNSGKPAARKVALLYAGSASNVESRILNILTEPATEVR